MQPPVVVGNIEGVNSIDFKKENDIPVAIVFPSDFSFPLKPNAQYSGDNPVSENTITVKTALPESDNQNVLLGFRLTSRVEK